jgi:hypothetical protein
MKTLVAFMFAAALTPLAAQEKPFTPPRTPDGHPDMQGAWARRGANLGEANAPQTALSDFNSTGQPYPTIFNNGVVTTLDRAKPA